MPWFNIANSQVAPGAPLTTSLLTGMRDNALFNRRKGFTVFDTAGSRTYVIPDETWHLLVFVTGSAASLGAISGNVRWGGGGGTAIKFVNVADLPDLNVSITVGAESSGSQGNASTWSDGIHTLRGGGGSVGIGGTATGGDINSSGGDSVANAVNGNYVMLSGGSFWGAGSRENSVNNAPGVSGRAGAVIILEL